MDNHTKIEIGVGIVGIGVTLWAILSRGSNASSVQTLPSTSGVALPPPIDLSGGNLDASAGGLLSGDGGSGGGTGGSSGGLTGGLGPSGNETTSGVPEGAVYVGNGIYASNGLAYIGPNKGPLANSGGDAVAGTSAPISGGGPAGNAALQSTNSGAGYSAPVSPVTAFQAVADTNTRQALNNASQAGSAGRLALPNSPANNTIGSVTITATPPIQAAGSNGGGTLFGPARPTPPSVVPPPAPAPSYPVATANSGAGYSGPAAPVQAVVIPPTTGGITPAQPFGSPLASGPLQPIVRSNVATPAAGPRTGIK